MPCFPTDVGLLWCEGQTHPPGSLDQAERHAGMEKDHHSHLGHRAFHRLHISYPPGRSHLTQIPIILRLAPLEQAESGEQAEARPHPRGALPRSAEQTERVEMEMEREMERGKEMEREMIVQKVRAGLQLQTFYRSF